jgi:hypothetical protein
MVGVEASNKESSQALVIGKLSLFSRLFIPPFTCAIPINLVAHP